MKKFSFLLFSLFVFVAGSAQTNLEPEFRNQIVVVKADSSTTLLQKETVKIKTNSTKFGYIPLPGTSLLDKSKSYLTVKGKASQTRLNAGRLTFIVRIGQNDEDPKGVFGVFSFDVNKNRQYKLAEAGLLSGVQTTTNFNTVPILVEKYGKESYLVVIENAQPGEYGIITSDISTVSTFGVE